MKRWSWNQSRNQNESLIEYFIDKIIIMALPYSSIGQRMRLRGASCFIYLSFALSYNEHSHSEIHRLYTKYFIT